MNHQRKFGKEEMGELRGQSRELLATQIMLKLFVIKSQLRVQREILFYVQQFSLFAKFTGTFDERSPGDENKITALNTGQYETCYRII